MLKNNIRVSLENPSFQLKLCYWRQLDRNGKSKFNIEPLGEVAVEQVTPLAHGHADVLISQILSWQCKWWMRQRNSLYSSKSVFGERGGRKGDVSSAPSSDWPMRRDVRIRIPNLIGWASVAHLWPTVRLMICINAHYCLKIWVSKVFVLKEVTSAHQGYLFDQKTVKIKCSVSNRCLYVI